jgi:hypothetical protein
VENWIRMKSLISVASGRLVLCLLRASDMTVVSSTSECVELLGPSVTIEMRNMFDEHELNEIEKIRQAAMNGMANKSRLIKNKKNTFLWFETQLVTNNFFVFLERQKHTLLNISQNTMHSILNEGKETYRMKEYSAAPNSPGKLSPSKLKEKLSPSRLNIIREFHSTTNIRTDTTNDDDNNNDNIYTSGSGDGCSTDHSNNSEESVIHPDRVDNTHIGQIIVNCTDQNMSDINTDDEFSDRSSHAKENHQQSIYSDTDKNKPVSQLPSQPQMMMAEADYDFSLQSAITNMYTSTGGARVIPIRTDSPSDNIENNETINDALFRTASSNTNTSTGISTHISGSTNTTSLKQFNSNCYSKTGSIGRIRGSSIGGSVSADDLSLSFDDVFEAAATQEFGTFANMNIYGKNNGRSRSNSKESYGSLDTSGHDHSHYHSHNNSKMTHYSVPDLISERINGGIESPYVAATAATRVSHISQPCTSFPSSPSPLMQQGNTSVKQTNVQPKQTHYYNSHASNQFQKHKSTNVHNAFSFGMSPLPGEDDWGFFTSGSLSDQIDMRPL